MTTTKPSLNLHTSFNPIPMLESEKLDIGSISESYPEYSTTSRLDELRATEYAYLDQQNHVYLDYTGSGLAAYSQHKAHQERLASTLCGNPHSVNPTSQAATDLVNQVRTRVLQHFKASPEEYAVVFTPNATGAARLVGESYKFSRRTKLVLTSDNHNSVNGLREFARRGHSRTVYIPTQEHDLRINPTIVQAALCRRSSLDIFCGVGKGGTKGLFAYPAQSNFSGVRHPLSWVSLAQENGFDVLLDAAAYSPTATIDLSIIQPEFLIISWYKLFGYPTGLGCLIVKRSAMARLTRPWFSGGTIKAVSVKIPWHEMATDESAFEDGTLNFLSIPDISFGLDWLSNIGIHVIATRIRCLTGWFISRLLDLHHSAGTPMIRIYGPPNAHSRGGNISFNFIDPHGKIIDERLVALESSTARISLRTGCFCNPGAGESAFGLRKRNLLPLLTTRAGNLDEYIRIIGLESAGCVRVSFGVASTDRDVDRFFEFAERTYKDRVACSIGLEPRESC